MHKQPENVSVAMAGLQMLRLFGASWPQLLVEEHAVHAILTALQLEGTKTAALANEVRVGRGGSARLRRSCSSQLQITPPRATRPRCSI